MQKKSRNAWSRKGKAGGDREEGGRALTAGGEKAGGDKEQGDGDEAE
jgi:hypothetical protein